MCRRPFALVCLVLTALLLAPVRPAVAAEAAPVDYVALGDSYASGVGASSALSWCFRSPQGYPTLWVQRHAVRSFAFAACGGATTADVRAFQLSALRRGTDLVSVTIGGNDAGFAPTVASCLLTGDATCVAAVNTARASMRDVLPGRLDATYREIRERAPYARVVVLGYPRLYDLGECAGGLSLTKRTALNAGADELATVIGARAAAAGFTFVDVRPAFATHGICAGTAWVNSTTSAGPFDSYHPTAAGYLQGYLPGFNAASA